MPGFDGALSSITSDIDAAESDGTLIDVTIRDVKVRALPFFYSRRKDGERERVVGGDDEKTTFSDAFASLPRLPSARSRLRETHHAAMCIACTFEASGRLAKLEKV